MRCPFVTIFLIVAAVVACGAVAGNPPSVAFTDVTAAAGLRFVHNNGAFGSKYLPETLGSGCLFLDADGDGWQDILLLNSTNWPGHAGPKSSLALYRNNRNGTFTDVTAASGLGVELYARFKADESSQFITGSFRLRSPDDNNERQSIHEHRSARTAPPSPAPKRLRQASTGGF